MSFVFIWIVGDLPWEIGHLMILSLLILLLTQFQKFGQSFIANI